MSNNDEPLFDGGTEHQIESLEPALCIRIRDLVNSQPYAVLCVQGEGQPYGALVAIAFSANLRQAVFATPVTTRKYRLLSECDHVALVVDNRPNQTKGLMEIEAITATGRVALLNRNGDFNCWEELLLTKHPYLKSFTKAETCALFLVDIVRFFHVARFQEVYQWIPDDDS
jgi:uncharacterized protein YhbP (UPF0306 family)